MEKRNHVALGLPLIDGLKAIASQLIVWHHLAFYGPMSDVARPLAPALLDGLAHWGRWAVQVFLVLGGFLAARSLAPVARPCADFDWTKALWRRYLRLSIPLAAVLLIAIAAAELARCWMVHDSIPASVTPLQWLAHLLLLQGVLGVESLSAGVWYVAIDFQLFVILLLVQRLVALCPSGWQTIALPGLVTGLGAVSMFYFNTRPELDDWGIYFFGAYALGAVTWWGSQTGYRRWAWLLGTLCVVALVFDFRERLALALVVAALLMLGQISGGITRWGQHHWLAYLSRISYSVFLVHFPVVLVVNAAFTRFMPATPGMQAAGMVFAWGVSLAAGHQFYRWVEAPANRAVQANWSN